MIKSFEFTDKLYFLLDKVYFAWIKVVNVQSQFSPTPLEVLIQFQDWELGLSVSFKIAQKFCAIFCAIFWKLPNSGDLPKFGSCDTSGVGAPLWTVAEVPTPVLPSLEEVVSW